MSITTFQKDYFYYNLPVELHDYIYKFIEHDVKIYYWLDKYDWKNDIHYLCNYVDLEYFIDNVNYYISKYDDIEKLEYYKYGLYCERQKYRHWVGPTNIVSNLGKFKRYIWYDDGCSDKDRAKLSDDIINKIFPYLLTINTGKLYNLLRMLIYIYDECVPLKDDYSDDDYIVE